MFDSNILICLQDSSDYDDIIYPKEMLPLGGEVPPLETFSDITPVMRVNVGEIYNPHKFFIISSFMKKTLNMLDENMQYV